MATFVSDEDAKVMLVGALALYKGRLMYFKDVAVRTALITDIETSESIRVPADLDVIKNPSTGRLGYVNMPEWAGYVQRGAMRMYKMGFSSQNLRTTNSETGNIAAAFPLYGNRLECLRKTYCNEFPSFDEAFKQVWEAHGDAGVAYDRSWALSRRRTKNVIVVYRGIPVGSVVEPDEGKIRWKNEVVKTLNKVRNRPALQWG